MPATDITPSAPHPILVLRQAVRWARAEGHRVRLGAFGVHCVSGEAPRWAPDHEGAIDPVGACILYAQADVDDPLAAACEALSVPEAWIAGFLCGLNREDATTTWSRAIHRKLVAAGVEAGTRYRGEFTRHAAPRGNA